MISTNSSHLSDSTAGGSIGCPSSNYFYGSLLTTGTGKYPNAN